MNRSPRREDYTYSLPRWRLTRWLADAGPDVPDDIRVALIGSLYGSLPIFASGLINTLMVAAVIALRAPTPPFLTWLALEALVCIVRMAVLIMARRAASQGRETPTDLYLLLAVCWGGSVGYGVFVTLASGDWVASTVACVSSAAMIGGICFRNFGAPRLVAAMILLSLGPCCIGAVLSGEPAMLIVLVQAPLYFVAMVAAAFRLNKMLVATMRAERENDHRARHDALTGLSNRLGLVRAFEERWPRASDAPEQVALFYLDLDGFKSVNDTHGHAAGDQLLKMVAGRVKEMLRHDDIAARIGGDEFVIISRMAGADDEKAKALAFGQQLVDEISPAYDLSENVVAKIGVSVGIALAPEHGEDVATLLAVADAALYEAKSNGKSRCAMASPMANLARARGLLEKAAAIEPKPRASMAA
ncbi:GGDEF domain-containing protein [Terrarubrum flagellatum]|uniref:GGDEF domain-containing protein n=1 Tax=Terrirubrum flagellatum TaxID=2895980 RepID=UPI0031456532